MYLSIVTTMYYSAPYIEKFHTRISQAVREITDSYEIIIVNDGSPDESLEIAIGICKQDDRVKVIDLSRNFGHHRAIMTGLKYAKGQIIFLIDCDLEEEPELVKEFHDIYSQNCCDVVYGVQKTRRGNFFDKLFGELYYFLLRNITGIDFPKNVATARLMSHRYVRSLIKHREREVFMLGLFHVTGYTQIPVHIVKSYKGKTTYNFSKKVRLFINSIVSFTDRPLILIFCVGLVISVVSGILIIDLLVRKLIFNTALEGWTSLIVSIWFLGGLIILFIGITAIYISKIFIETKQRPYSIVRHIYKIHSENSIK